MKAHQQPEDWHAPPWHPDHGDASAELEHLRAFAQKLLSHAPNITVALETPEPGLMDLRVLSSSGIIAEVHSVPTGDGENHRRLAIFLRPDTGDEIEVYSESVEDAANLCALLEDLPSGVLSRSFS
jgi:hypothetical protein